MGLRLSVYRKQTEELTQVLLAAIIGRLGASKSCFLGRMRYDVATLVSVAILAPANSNSVALPNVRTVVEYTMN